VQTPAVDAARERARQQAEAARARAETVRTPAPVAAPAAPATVARPVAPAAPQTARPAPANANADAEARVRAAEARAKAEAERRQQAEARLKAEEHRKQKAEAQAKARTEAQAKAKAEADRKQQAESRPRAEAPSSRAAQQTGPAATANTTASLPAKEEAKPAQPSADFRWPARGRVISGFSGRGGNEGINISVPEGTPVRAAEGGTVAYAGNELKGYGNLVLIRHDNGYVSAYAHNGELNVKRGERVGRGQVIARSGQTGNVSSPQLHFELRRGSNPVDPMPYLNN
jgi:murein DD-endopeptidase MepM/ murein hydrolase activator NlpD